MEKDIKPEESIVAFLNSFLTLQANALSAYYKQDIPKLNQLVDQLNSYGTQHLQDMFGVSYQKKADKDVSMLYENDDVACRPAILFMIKKHHYPGLGIVYLAFVSAVNPYKKNFSKCYFIVPIKNNYQIIAQYAHIENRKKNMPEWDNCGGEDIYLNRLGKPLEVIRITPPSDNTNNLKEYEK